MTDKTALVIIIGLVIFFNATAHAYKSYKTNLRIIFLEEQLQQKIKHINHIEKILVDKICLICRK